MGYFKISIQVKYNFANNGLHQTREKEVDLDQLYRPNQKDFAQDKKSIHHKKKPLKKPLSMNTKWRTYDALHTWAAQKNGWELQNVRLQRDTLDRRHFSG